MLLGRDITASRPYKRPVNTVFQQYGLFPHLNVFDNVAFGLKERREPRAEITEPGQRMLDLVGLDGRGERARRSSPAASSSASRWPGRWCSGPEVLLLDEPLGALDLKLRRQMQLLLKTLQRELSITFVYVTHDQEEAFSMSDRVGVMNDGKIEQVGTPRMVYQRPATEFVADFVGSSNRLGGTVTTCYDGFYEVDLDGIGPVRGPGVAGLKAGDRACAIVRPEAISPQPAGPGRVGVSGRILDTAYLGHQMSCVVETASAMQLTMTVHEAVATTDGDACELSWAAQSMWLVALTESP